jgi:hypothetical protein
MRFLLVTAGRQKVGSSFAATQWGIICAESADGRNDLDHAGRLWLTFVRLRLPQP